MCVHSNCNFKPTAALSSYDCFKLLHLHNNFVCPLAMQFELIFAQLIICENSGCTLFSNHTWPGFPFPFLGHVGLEHLPSRVCFCLSFSFNLIRAMYVSNIQRKQKKLTACCIKASGGKAEVPRGAPSPQSTHSCYGGLAGM